jgi:hypothetical protein
MERFLVLSPNRHWDTAAPAGLNYDDDLSSLREKLFIGFFLPYAEYYSQTNGWGIRVNVHTDCSFSTHRGGIEYASAYTHH